MTPPGEPGDADGESLHLRKARALHGPAGARSRLRRRGRVSRREHGETRCVQRAHHGRSRAYKRPRADQKRGRWMRRGARSARTARGAWVPTETAQAVLDFAPSARLVFSCGWHITRDGQDVYSWKLKAIVKIGGPLARLTHFADLDNQVEACRRVFASDTRWTVVRGSDLEEGDSQGAYPCGAGTSVTRFSRATAPAVSTSPSSWSRRSRTMTSSTRLQRSSAERHRRRSPTRTLGDSVPVSGRSASCFARPLLGHRHAVATGSRRQTPRFRR